MKPTTVKIDAARREKLKDAAFEISMAKREVINMTEVIKYLVDNYTDDAVKEMKEMEGHAN